jgi:hypothetical protein
MQKEKIALIALVIIVVAALSVFIVAINTTFFENLFKEKLTIAEGDCADVNYIGMYASNNTVFDKSYQYLDNKSGGTPLKIFVNFNTSAPSPRTGYTSGMIKGFIQGLIGMDEGQTKIIGPILPKDAYGINETLKTGDIFTSKYLAFGMNQTVEVTKYDGENLSLKWIDMINGTVFTMPQLVINDLQSANETEMVTYPPPCYIWENATHITNITDTTVTVFTTPTSATNISETVKLIQGPQQMLIFPNATTATWNDTSITVTCFPKRGTNYTFQTQGYSGLINVTITINNITGDKINASYITDENPEPATLEVFKIRLFSPDFTQISRQCTFHISTSRILKKQDIA